MRSSLGLSESGSFVSSSPNKTRARARFRRVAGEMSSDEVEGTLVIGPVFSVDG